MDVHDCLLTLLFLLSLVVVIVLQGNELFMLLLLLCTPEMTKFTLRLLVVPYDTLGAAFGGLLFL